MRKIVAGCQSIKGNYREKNQDRIVCLLSREKGKRCFGVACVCDGIGSFEKSELAAQMVTEGIAGWYEGRKQLADQLAPKELLADLEGTLWELNELVYEYQSEQHIRIGCTMSMVLLLGEEYHIYHVGDSRIYSVREELYQLTKDEVNQVSRNGSVTSYLANYMGKSRALWLTQGQGTLRKGELLVLGTDGFFKRLDYSDFASLCKSAGTDRGMEKALLKLLSLALQRGERDNISCIMLRQGRGSSLTGREYRRLP